MKETSERILHRNPPFTHDDSSLNPPYERDSDDYLKWKERIVERRSNIADVGMDYIRLYAQVEVTTSRLMVLWRSIGSLIFGVGLLAVLVALKGASVGEPLSLYEKAVGFIGIMFMAGGVLLWVRRHLFQKEVNRLREGLFDFTTGSHFGRWLKTDRQEPLVESGLTPGEFLELKDRVQKLEEALDNRS